MGNLYIVQYLQGERKVSEKSLGKHGTLSFVRDYCCCSPVVNVVGKLCTTDVVGVHSLDVCVSRLGKLKARSPPVPDNVLDLLGDRVVVKGWQERKGLKEPASVRRKLMQQPGQERKATVRKRPDKDVARQNRSQTPCNKVGGREPTCC